MTILDPIKEFREDHRKVRDGLLSLIDALKSKDISKAREILGNLDKLLGPHFMYEEEALYPALRIFLGEYVDELIKEHNKVIETSKKCVELLKKDKLNDDEAEEAASAARALLVHVSNCDGLAILTERLEDSDIKKLSEKYSSAREKGIGLIEWAEKIRK